MEFTFLWARSKTICIVIVNIKGTKQRKAKVRQGHVQVTPYQPFQRFRLRTSQRTGHRNFTMIQPEFLRIYSSEVNHA